MSAPEWNPPQTIEELYGKDFNPGASGNAPSAGSRKEQELPKGNASLQLYSLGTPNGMKVGILLEELGVDYDATTIRIGQGDQFNSGFVKVNPNSKIPALVDNDGPGGKPISVFESANILLYLAEKYNKFTFTDARLKTEMMGWLFWQMSGQGPAVGNFSHFFAFAPADQVAARNYGVSRYGMETQRICDVLDKHLAGKEYIVGDTYSIADIINYTWWRALNVGIKHKSGLTAKAFLNLDQYKNLVAWAARIESRPAVKRGVQVCGFTGPAKPWLEQKQ